MKGAVVLVPFPYTDLSATKMRPAVIMIENESDVVVAFISPENARLPRSRNSSAHPIRPRVHDDGSQDRFNHKTR